MSIQDFIDEAKQRTGGGTLSPTGKEIHELAMSVYFSIKSGHAQGWVEHVSKMLIDNIAPNLSSSDTTKTVEIIESIIVTVLSEFFEDGTIIKKEVINKK